MAQRARVTRGAGTIDGQILDDRIGHLIGLTRIDAGIAREILTLLEERNAILIRKIRSLLDDGQFSALRGFVAELSALTRETYDQVYAKLRSELAALATYEAEYNRKMMAANLPAKVWEKLDFAIPPPEYLQGLVLSKPMQGQLLRRWTEQQAAGTVSAVWRAIQFGMASGEGAERIAIRLVGGVVDGIPVTGVLDVKMYQARAIVRTGVMHTANETSDAIWEANGDIVMALQWISTLDFRTTSYCVARDSALYDLQTKEPVGHDMPWGAGPGRYHWQCRSSSAPVTDLADLDRGIRSSIGGGVEKQDAPTWLHKQPLEHLEGMFGKERARLFKSGRYSFRELVDDDGAWLTLDELRGLEDARLGS